MQDTASDAATILLRWEPYSSGVSGLSTTPSYGVLTWVISSSSQEMVGLCSPCCFCHETVTTLLLVFFGLSSMALLSCARSTMRPTLPRTLVQSLREQVTYIIYEKAFSLQWSSWPSFVEFFLSPIISYRNILRERGFFQLNSPQTINGVSSNQVIHNHLFWEWLFFIRQYTYSYEHF